MTLWLIVMMGLAFGGRAPARAPLTNDDILKLVRAGFGDSLILQAIDRNESGFDVSPDALAVLRKAGVEDRVLSAMSARAHPRAVRKPGLLDPGVYVKRGETYADVPAEVVNWQPIGDEGKGAPVRLLLSGRVPGSRSPLSLTDAVEFLIVCSGSDQVSEYVLLRGEQTDDAREFRVEGGLDQGTALAVSASDRSILAVQIDESYDLGVRMKVGPLRKGEYRPAVTRHCSERPARAAKHDLHPFGLLTRVSRVRRLHCRLPAASASRA